MLNKLIRYFLETLQGLEPQLRKRESIQELTRGVGEVMALVEATMGQDIDEKSLEAIAAKATTLRALIEGKDR